MRVADERRQAYLALVGSIESGLREAYAVRHEQGRIDLDALAERLALPGRGRAVDMLSGGVDLKLSEIAGIAWALGYTIEVRLYDPDLAKGGGHG